MVLFLSWATAKAQESQVQTSNGSTVYTRATSYGLGFTSLQDTYLSPETYKGWEARFSRETLHQTKLKQGKIWQQTYFQGNFGYTDNRAENNLRNLNDYANKRYKEIQNNIFKNGGDSYFTILSRFGDYLVQTKESIDDKYFTKSKTPTQWDSKLMLDLFIGIFVLGIIAVILNQLIVRWFITKLIKKGKFKRISDRFLAKRTFIILTTTAVTFAIIPHGY